jgi:glycerophosphoryl diester phosphodiesterase
VKKFLRKLLKILGIFALAVILLLGVLYVYLALQTGEKAAGKEIFKNGGSSPLVFAHRGGGGLYPENTLEAFQYSAQMGVDVLELDIHSTADGKLVVIHDSTVHRTTDGNGKVNEITLTELKKLDAGYQFSRDGGQTFPFRGKNLTVPTLEEIFAAFPRKIFNVEMKQSAPSIAKPLCQILRERKMTAKVIVGSFRQTALDEFRQECSEVATSASPLEAGKFLLYQKSGLAENYRPPMQALQVPRKIGIEILTKDFVESAHRQNLKVHVWTINETSEMQRLLNLGVDGIITDYPDRLLKLLNR